MSQADLAVEAAFDAVLFHAPGAEGAAYATVPVDSHLETHPVNSRGFRRWLSRIYYRAHRKAIGDQALQDGLNVIAGKAMFDGPAIPVAVRLAGHEGAIYLDLADEDWRAVRIDEGGWRLVSGEECPIRFIRRRGMLALPEPVRGGSIDELRELVNLPDDDGWHLVVAWVVAALRPTGPYPALAVNGEQGCAKSTLCRFLRALVDPNQSPLRRPPKDERDLMIAANNGWIVCFDNLSGIAPSLSDALCCLCTGGGFATRELYSNDEEMLFTAQRPVLLNGIDEIATRPDLLDRCLNIALPRIAEDRRCDEADLFARFEAACPRILGALLDAVSVAQREVHHIRLDRLPRMADFAKWATAAEAGLGWKSGTFMSAYLGNRESGHEMAIEASLVGQPLMGLMHDRERWIGTATELLAELEGNHSSEAQRRQRGWPGTGKAMSNALRRLAPTLRALGVNYTPPNREGKARNRIFTLERSGMAPSVPSASTAHLTHSPEAAGETDGPEAVADVGGSMPGAHRLPPNPPHGPQKAGVVETDEADEADGQSPAHSETEVRL